MSSPESGCVHQVGGSCWVEPVRPLLLCLPTWAAGGHKRGNGQALAPLAGRLVSMFPQESGVGVGGGWETTTGKTTTGRLSFQPVELRE